MRRVVPLLFLSLLGAPGGPAAAGETACWFENGAVVAPAAIGGIAGDYVIDLSAPRTLLHVDVAQGAGYVETALTLPVRLAGQRRGRADRRPEPGLSRRRLLDADHRGDRRRHPGPLCGDPGLLAVPPAPGAPRNNEAGQDGGLPVTMVGGVPTIIAAASDGLKGASGPFALDTASGGGVRARGAPDGPRQKPAGTLRGLSLNGTLRQDLPAVMAGDLPDGVVGALGVQVLAAYRLRLDPKALRLWLTPGSRPTGRKRAKKKGPAFPAEP
jgi:hypothetical protein